MTDSEAVDSLQQTPEIPGEPAVESQSARQPLYTPRQVYTGSMLGGPFAAVYFVWKNFNTLADERRSRRTLVLGGTAQGLWAEEQRGSAAANQWVQEENRKCPRQVRQWFEIVDKENLFDKEAPASATVKAEDIEDGTKWFGREQLPSPPNGYQVEHLRRIHLGGNECCLASYMKQGKYPEGLSTIYLWQGHQWSKLIQNEGTIDNLEGIEFIRINPRHDPLVVVTNFGGGSGIGRTLYSVSRNGRVRRLLNIGNWNEGGYSLWDFDGDGVFELVHRTRVFHPASLKARLSKCGDYDLVTPILYKDTIYRWKGNRFEATGSRYWVEE